MADNDKKLWTTDGIKVGQRGVWVSEPMTVTHIADNVGEAAFVDFVYDDGEPRADWHDARVWCPRGRLVPVEEAQRLGLIEATERP